MKQSGLKTCNGFTLLEVLVILTLIAFLTVVVVSMFQDRDGARHITTGDILAAHLRYVQMRSMDSGASWGIQYNNSNGQNAYWMFRHPSADPHPLPGESDDRVNLVSGITVGPGDFTLRFDDWGRPIANLPFVDGQLSLSLTMAGKSLPLTISANTGYVQWQP
jgi:type II secretory pathway pseudopilin PulG